MAKTPYRRVLASPLIDEEIKMKLKKQYDMLNPIMLKREITRLQNELLRLNALKEKMSKEVDISTKPQSSFEYISNWGSVSAFKYIFRWGNRWGRFIPFKVKRRGSRLKTIGNLSNHLWCNYMTKINMNSWDWYYLVFDNGCQPTSLSYMKAVLP